MLGDELLEERDVARVVDPRRRHPDVGRVLRRRERARVRRDHEGVLGERADDVVALADARQEDGYVAVGPVHPPVPPL